MNFFEVMFARSISGGTGSGAKTIDFSTEEQETGAKWIDGSMIYCITFDRSEHPVGANGTISDLSSLNIGTFLDGMLTASTSGITAETVMGTFGRGLYIENNDLKYYTEDSGLVSYVTIWYTKAAAEPAEPADDAK